MWNCHVELLLVLIMARNITFCGTASLDEYFETMRANQGDEVILRCRTGTSETVFWGYYDAVKGEHRQVSVFGKLINGYANDTLRIDQHSLIIRNAQPRHSGLYNCIDDDGAGKKYLIFLSVVGSKGVSSTRFPHTPSKSDDTEAAPVVTDVTFAESTTYDAIVAKEPGVQKMVIGFAVVISILCLALLIMICFICHRRLRRTMAVSYRLLNIKSEQEGTAVIASCDTTTLPIEVLELVLLQAVALSHKRYDVRLLPAADRLSIETMLNVCQEWNTALVGRRWNRRKLRRLFTQPAAVVPAELMKAVVLLRDKLRHEPHQPREAKLTALQTMASVCEHWRTNVIAMNRKKIRRVLSCELKPQLISSLPTKPDVCGVAQLADNIYVAHYESNQIQVFRNSFPFTRLEEIPVKGVSPVDMAGCASLQQLFISDSLNQCVWRVDVRSHKKNKFVDKMYTPWTMSVMARRLLVTAHGGNSIYAYDLTRNDASPFSVNLPKHKDAVHSVETTPGSFIVCGYNAEGEKNRRGDLIQVDRRGDVIHAIRDYKLVHPRHVTVHSDGSVLVADGGKQQIVIFDSKLRFQRILIDATCHKLKGKLIRLHYAEKNKQLIVGMNGSVNVYRWK